MPEGGFFEQKRASPTTLGLVVLLHGAAITALAMSKMEIDFSKKPPPTTVYEVPEPVPPKPEPAPPKEPQPQTQPRTQIDYVPPLLPPLPSENSGVVLRPLPDLPIFDPGAAGKAETRPVDPPKPLPPVRIEAQMVRGAELQPPYPPSEERAENEGRVSVRVRIGADGRVKSVEKVSATSDSFYRATERHALRAWRFKPATLDGRPVESSKVVSVTFRLDG